LLASLVVAPAAFARDRDWVATWNASPVTASTLTFSNQTLREIVHISIGGNRVRVRLTNAFGGDLLVIGEAHVAIRSTGSSIVPGTDRALTFGGQTSLRIPPGAPVISDPVNLHMNPFEDLAVSIYVPEDTGPATVHGTGVQTSYISDPGDFVGEEAFPVAMTTTSRFFLTGVEVLASERMNAVVTIGDSITDGTRSTVDTNNRWPDHLAVRLYENRIRMAVINAGISGNRVLHDGAGPNALSRFDRDVLAQNGVTHVIVMEGINDIGQSFLNPNQAVTADEIIGGLRQLATRAHERELKIIGGTMTPYEGASYFSPEGEVMRETVNDWIRNTPELDGMIDFDRATRDPRHPTRFLPFFDSGDHLHPNDAGYTVMAEAIDLSLLQ
jgi:lysophospholipase L1-like esterase